MPNVAAEATTRPPLRRQLGWGALALLALTFLLFGSHVRDGFLSDDFSYAERSSTGLVPLLRTVTTDSYPRTLRPIPALAWALCSRPERAAVLHVVSLVLHAAIVVVVGLLALRQSGRVSGSLVLAALWIVFPLAGEPVLWLSGSFDVWACLFGAGTVLAACSSSRQMPLICAVLFALGLLSKESVFTLPLLMPLLVPRGNLRRVLGVLVAVAGGYVALRLVVLHGLGGYLDTSGVPTVWSPQFSAFFKTATLYLPYLVLVPVKHPGALTAPIACVSACLIAGFLAWGGFGAGLRRLVLAVSVAGLALAPTVPVLGLSADHSGSRFLYWPACTFLLALGRGGGPARRPVACGVALAACWAVASVHNDRAWTAASHEVARTLAAMETAQSRFAAGATVLVDARDMVDGAYVFRNGLAAAASLAGLRGDLTWRRGTAASLNVDAAQRLGRDVFVIGADHLGRPVDWTSCERALAASESPTIRTWTGQDVERDFEISGRDGNALHLVSPVVTLPSESHDAHVRLGFSPCQPQRNISGVVLWRADNSRSFGFTESRVFDTKAEGTVSVRLDPVPSARLAVRINFDAPLPLTCLRELAVSSSPRVCEH